MSLTFRLCVHLRNYDLTFPLFPKCVITKIKCYSPPELYLRHIKTPNSSNAVYIGRPSVWGNPFSVQKHGRAGAIKKYESYLFSSGLYKQLEKLRNVEIICHCYPLPCHGDVILKYLYSSNIQWQFLPAPIHTTFLHHSIFCQLNVSP